MQEWVSALPATGSHPRRSESTSTPSARCSTSQNSSRTRPAHAGSVSPGPRAPRSTRLRPGTSQRSSRSSRRATGWRSGCWTGRASVSPNWWGCAGATSTSAAPGYASPAAAQKAGRPGGAGFPFRSSCSRPSRIPCRPRIALWANRSSAFSDQGLRLAMTRACKLAGIPAHSPHDFSTPLHLAAGHGRGRARRTRACGDHGRGRAGMGRQPRSGRAVAGDDPQVPRPLAPGARLRRPRAEPGALTQAQALAGGGRTPPKPAPAKGLRRTWRIPGSKIRTPVTERSPCKSTCRWLRGVRRMGSR
jgi:hypothetical protein